jgi:hypothetical protein
MSGGSIAGIIIGVLFFIVFIAAIIWLKRRQLNNSNNMIGQNGTNTNNGQGTTIIYTGNNANQAAYGMQTPYNQPFMQQPMYNQPIIMGNNYPQQVPYQQPYQQPYYDQSNYNINQGQGPIIIQY